MPFWRREAGASAPCPDCDAPVDVTVARDDGATCPQCGRRLLPVHVAGFWSRVAAAGVDLVVLALTAGTLSWALVSLVPPPALVENPWGMAALLELLAASPRDVLAWTTPFLVMSGLYLLLFWGLSGQTPGQRLLRIRVVDRRGNAPGPVLATIRVVALGVGLLPLALGALWIAFDLEKRGLHDRVAGTYVIRATPRKGAL